MSKYINALRWNIALSKYVQSNSECIWSYLVSKACLELHSGMCLSSAGSSPSLIPHASPFQITITMTFSQKQKWGKRWTQLQKTERKSALKLSNERCSLSFQQNSTFLLGNFQRYARLLPKNIYGIKNTTGTFCLYIQGTHSCLGQVPNDALIGKLVKEHPKCQLFTQSWEKTKKIQQLQTVSRNILQQR